MLSGITRVTDGRTDRRTDRILIARPRLHFMQRGKNQVAKHRNVL